MPINDLQTRKDSGVRGSEFVMTCIWEGHKRVSWRLPLGSDQVSARRGTGLGKGSKLNIYVGSLVSTSFVEERLVRLEGQGIGALECES